MSTPDHTAVVDAVILHSADHVATALRPLSAGETVHVGGPEGLRFIVATAPIPLCHKIAVKAVKQGAAVCKYGEFIGDATTPIEPGDHVHIHNIKSRAARQKC